jgi:uncharacterized protein
MLNIRQRHLIMLISLLLIFLPLPLWAADSPIPSPSEAFYVLDQAGVLDADTEQIIVRTSAALQEKTKAQIVVVTVLQFRRFTPRRLCIGDIAPVGDWRQRVKQWRADARISERKRIPDRSRLRAGRRFAGRQDRADSGRVYDPVFSGEQF